MKEPRRKSIDAALPRDSGEAVAGSADLNAKPRHAGGILTFPHVILGAH